MALNMAFIISSDVGLSHTTTSSGLLDEARTSPQVPSCSTMRMPLTVTSSRDRVAGQLARRRLAHLLEVLHRLFDDAVLLFVGAVRRHGGRTPGLRQVAIEVRHRIVGLPVEHAAAPLWP
jgi:hypothetical protein